MATLKINGEEKTVEAPDDMPLSMIFWSALFNDHARFEPDAARSPEWNRGAYIAEALAHCGECHTPRNLAFALDNRRKFAGAIAAGWKAFNISSDASSGIGTWSDNDILVHLSTGHAAARGTAAGPMGEAFDQSFSNLAPSDLRALVTYLFEGACVACHNWTGVSQLSPFATITGARAVNDRTATNVAQIVISGTVRTGRRALCQCRLSAAFIQTWQSPQSPTTSPNGSTANHPRSPRRKWRTARPRRAVIFGHQRQGDRGHE